MSDALKRAIDALAREGVQSDYAFDLVEPALREFGERDLANRVFDAVPDAPWNGIATFLNIASWDVSPADASGIFRTIEAWLIDSNDLKRVQVALNIEIIPFSKAGSDPQVLDTVLARVASIFPETAPMCQRLLEQPRPGRPAPRS